MENEVSREEYLSSVFATMVMQLTNMAAMFMGKVEAIKAGASPHPLLNGDAWTKQIVDGEVNFAKRVAEERAKRGK